MAGRIGNKDMSTVQNVSVDISTSETLCVFETPRPWDYTLYRLVAVGGCWWLLVAVGGCWC